MLADKTILQMKYARIVRIFADKLHMSYEDALGFFYQSYTYRLISNGIADMHCMSDGYLADELLQEWESTNKQDSVEKGNQDIDASASLDGPEF